MSLRLSLQVSRPGATTGMSALGLAKKNIPGRGPPGPPSTHSVVVDLLERLVPDGALKDDPLERVGFVAGHQLHTDHLSFSHGHVTEHLGCARGGEGHQLLAARPGPPQRTARETPALQERAPQMWRHLWPPDPLCSTEPSTGQGWSNCGQGWRPAGGVPDWFPGEGHSASSHSRAKESGCWQGLPGPWSCRGLPQSSHGTQCLLPQVTQTQVQISGPLRATCGSPEGHLAP